MKRERGGKKAGGSRERSQGGGGKEERSKRGEGRRRKRGRDRRFGGGGGRTASGFAVKYVSKLHSLDLCPLSPGHLIKQTLRLFFAFRQNSVRV
jgi:hypothetical protein